MLRAREILRNLESGERDEAGEPRLAARGARSGQLGLFAAPTASSSALLEELRGIDPLTLTPIEAMTTLASLVERAKRDGKG